MLLNKIQQKKNESRKDFLVRVAIEMLDNNTDSIDTIIYDDAECDAGCLAEDLRNEFGISGLEEY